ncbi:MAG TPA: aminotransferase class V-fold PLP-dependent enzyme [Fimbriimonadaceae bacterium]|nr:aminotransferase class V-fold PLP-dependent enzyme [Fimbriimonadaceae bacterium]
MPVASAPSVEAVRAWFPSLAGGFAFMDNAGGSQMPGCVANAVHDYMLTSFVQVGASYPASRRATQIVADAHQFVETLFGGEGLGKVILGASSSALCRMLSDCYAEVLGPGDEVVVAESGHEANVFPWVVLGNRGVTVKMWEADPQTGESHIETLASLLSQKTRIVAFPHVSNLLGAVENVKEAVERAHKVGARVVLDSVAYAPHHALDVAKWGVDFCVFSCYKVFGPHMAALWGSNEALADVTGRNHPFIPRDQIPGKFELGGVLHEGCAGLLALKSYFAFLAGRPEAEFDRGILLDAFKNASELEEPLTRKLIDFLNSKSRVGIVGPATSGPERVATVSFLHDALKPAEIAAEAERHDIGMRNGNFYSVRLLERLGIPSSQGVARVSFAHYNSPAEVESLIRALDPIL